MTTVFEVDGITYRHPYDRPAPGVRYARELVQLMNNHECWPNEDHCVFWNDGSAETDWEAHARKLPSEHQSESYNWRPGDPVPCFGGVS